MMRSRSRGSDIEEPSEEALLETERARLQRSYRVMQNDYKAYKEETKRIINKQKMLIDQLDTEREELDTMLAKMETNQNKSKDETNAKQLSELSSCEKEYHELIQEERDSQQQLDNQILELEKQICQQRKKMGGAHNSTAKHIAIHKRKGVLENRLDKAMVHFNQQLAINRELRDEIDHLRRERSVFENLYKKLAKELENCKKDMSEVIETSTQAFEQRDEALSKMNALKERSDKDQQHHDSEMKDLLRTISHDNKVKEFMSIKASDRMEYKVEEAAKRKKDEKGIDADHAIIQSYEQAFKRIQEVTGERDIEIIVANFIRNEEENFALFNYVNELNAQVEGLQDEVAGVRANIEKYKTEDIKLDDNRKQIMRQLENKYEAASRDTEKAEENLKIVNKALDQLLSGVDAIFNMIGCDPGPIRDMLGGDSGINKKNIMVYMGLIEHKTTDLLNILSFIQLKSSDIDGVTPPKVEPTILQPPPHTKIQIMPPSTGDDDFDMEMEMDDDELRPLSQLELRQRITRGMERKQHAELQTIKPQKSSSGGNREKKKVVKQRSEKSGDAL